VERRGTVSETTRTTPSMAAEQRCLSASSQRRRIPRCLANVSNSCGRAPSLLLRNQAAQQKVGSGKQRVRVCVWGGQAHFRGHLQLEHLFGNQRRALAARAGVEPLARLALGAVVAARAGGQEELRREEGHRDVRRELSLGDVAPEQRGVRVQHRDLEHLVALQPERDPAVDDRTRLQPQRVANLARLLRQQRQQRRVRLDALQVRFPARRRRGLGALCAVRARDEEQEPLHSHLRGRRSVSGRAIGGTEVGMGRGRVRVQLVRRDGRDVSTLYGREGGGERGGGGDEGSSTTPPPSPYCCPYPCPYYTLPLPPSFTTSRISGLCRGCAAFF